MSTIGNDLKAAHDLLESAGNCAIMMHDEVTGQYCAWGALNQVVRGNALSRVLGSSGHFEVLAKHLPEDWHAGLPACVRVVSFNNRHTGQPVIDLFAKAAADEGYEVASHD